MALSLRALVAALGLSLALGGGADLASAQSDKDKKEEKQKPGGSVDQITGKRLVDAVEALKKEDLKTAKAELGKLNPAKLSPYELSRVEQLYTAIFQSEGNYDEARVHLQKAIESGGLNDQELQQAKYQFAQFFIAQEKWKEGIDALKQWFATAEAPNSGAYYLLAVAYYQLEDFKSALEPAQKAVELSDKPQESWLQLLLALRIEREEFKLAVPILKQLIEAAPGKKNYWVQLASVQAQLGSYEDAAVPLQIAYNGGMLTEARDIQRLAEVLVQISVPHRAALILEKGVQEKVIKDDDQKVQELLANCWIASRDFKKAIPPLQRAAELSPSGDAAVRLGEVYLQNEDWENAASAVKRGIDKGKIKNPGNANLLVGIALYSQKKPKEAKGWFERARGFDNTRQAADGWLRQIEFDLSNKTQG
jgi:tetratricopeptide (TPR) repeat protein